MNIRNAFLLLSLAMVIMTLGCRQSSDKATDNRIGEEEKSAVIEKGRSIAMATFATLSAQLQQAMKEGGAAEAIRYCNLNANTLVDSLSRTHYASIRRTSLKVRNPANKPNTDERKVLDAYAAMAASGSELKPLVELLDQNTVSFYAPISVNAFCLQCHGKVGESLKSEDYAVIKQHYPQDEATGYAEGDLRGMWSIQFKRQ